MMACATRAAVMLPGMAAAARGTGAVPGRAEATTFKVSDCGVAACWAWIGRAVESRKSRVRGAMNRLGAVRRSFRYPCPYATAGRKVWTRAGPERLSAPAQHLLEEVQRPIIL